MKLTQAPIFRMYHLTIAQTDQTAFVDEGTHNMFTSFENEPGTLAMYATHSDKLGESNFIFELYQDLAQYQIHANSPQFKRYGQLAQKVLTGRKMIELQPELILTNEENKVSGVNDSQVVLSEFSLSENDVNDFLTGLKKLSATDIGTAIYVAAKNVEKTDWMSLEINPSENNSALQQLVQAFQITKTTKKLTVDTMVNRPKIEYKN